MKNKNDFIIFYNDTYQSFFLFLVNMIQNKEIAEDFCQESYLKFIRQAPENLLVEKRQSYLYMIGRRLVYDYFKRKKLFMNFELSELHKSIKRNYEIESDLLIKSELSQILNYLKPKEKELILLAYIEDKSHKEIAEITGMNEKSIKVLLMRYREKLRNLSVKHQLDLGDFYDK